MSTQTKFVIGGVVVGGLILYFFPGWLTLLIVLGLLGAPLVGYMMLDPSQRKRVRAQGRKRLGS